MSKTKHIKDIQTHVVTYEDQLNQLKISLWDNYVAIIKDEYKSVDSSLNVADTAGRTVSLKKLTQERTTLVLRYSFKDCNACIDSIYNKLEMFKRDNPSLPVLALTDSYNSHDFYVKSVERVSKISVYDLYQGNLGLFLENQNRPLLFVLTPEFKAVKLFLPIIEVPKQTGEYLTHISSYLTDVNKQIGN